MDGRHELGSIDTYQTIRPLVPSDIDQNDSNRTSRFNTSDGGGASSTLSVMRSNCRGEYTSGGGRGEIYSFGSAPAAGEGDRSCSREHQPSMTRCERHSAVGLMGHSMTYGVPPTEDHHQHSYHRLNSSIQQPRLASTELPPALRAVGLSHCAGGARLNSYQCTTLEDYRLSSVLASYLQDSQPNSNIHRNPLEYDEVGSRSVDMSLDEALSAVVRRDDRRRDSSMKCVDSHADSQLIDSFNLMTNESKDRHRVSLSTDEGSRKTSPEIFQFDMIDDRDSQDVTDHHSDKDIRRYDDQENNVKRHDDINCRHFGRQCDEEDSFTNLDSDFEFRQEYTLHTGLPELSNIDKMNDKKELRTDEFNTRETASEWSDTSSCNVTISANAKNKYDNDDDDDATSELQWDSSVDMNILSEVAQSLDGLFGMSCFFSSLPPQS